MALYPNATYQLWSPYSPERFITPTLVILHTNAVNAENPGPSYDNGSMLSWHFQVGEHGTVYQHRDTSTRAAANYLANGQAISIETWDGGNPEGNPWNTAQMDALVDLIGWCCDTHHVLRSKPTAWNGNGVGYHRMFDQWNKPVHSCPGNTRAKQFDAELMPRLTAPKPPIPKPIQETDMTPGQCLDATGREWVFVVGDDRQTYAYVDGAKLSFTIGGSWTSGLTARLRADGMIAVKGRGNDGHLWQLIFDPQHADKGGVVNDLGGHIFPAA